MVQKGGLLCVALTLGAIAAVSAGEKQATDSNKTAPDRQIVFKVQGLTCPAVKSLGCGHRLAPVFARLEKIAGVEKTRSNVPGTMIRVSIAASADREKVAEAVLKDLTEDTRSPLRLNDEELKQSLEKEQWRLPDELSSIEFRTLALDRVKGFADAAKLNQGVTDKLMKTTGELWDRLAQPAITKQSSGNTDWTAFGAEFIKALDEQTKGLLSTDERERLQQALTCRPER